jgi:hypothetical protein
MAAPSATAALKASIVVVAPLLARTGSIKPYRIAVSHCRPGEKNP